MYFKIISSSVSTKIYVMGTQKNRLDETVLLSTQNMIRINCFAYHKLELLSCQPRVTVTSCLVYIVIRDLESTDH